MGKAAQKRVVVTREDIVVRALPRLLQILRVVAQLREAHIREPKFQALPDDLLFCGSHDAPSFGACMLSMAFFS